MMVAMNKGHKNFALAQIVKGPPIFKRHLYIASTLFVAIILLTTFVLIQLAMGSLNDRVDTEMITLSEVSAQKISDRIQLANERSSVLSRGIELQWNDEIKLYMDGLLAEQEEIVYIFVQNLRGEILWKSFKRGMELEQNLFSKILLTPSNPRPPKIELASLSNPQNHYFDLIIQILLNDQPQLIIHFGLDRSLIKTRFDEFRSAILKRIILASSVVVGILSMALAYILWLLKRAQVVEAEAHMADRLAYLGTLASGLAHEIRNPLSAINLNLQMLEEDLNQGDTNAIELISLLKGTKQEIRRLDRLATDFLFYAKPFGLKMQSTPVSEILEDVLRLVSQECQKGGVNLLRLNGADHLVIQADRDLLKQAILNLVVNAQDAVSFRPMGDRNITIGATQDQGQVAIHVRDNGPGIGPEEAKNLFKLFHSNKRGGTGLGLPIAQRIVESHGGKIEWRNLSQGGTEFTIRLKL
jgi:signal transduction histidine kinase